MKRRHVLKSLAAVAIGSTIPIGCTPTDSIWQEGAKAININPEAGAFLDDLSQLILPTQDIDYETPESLSQFIQTNINDCYSTEDIVKFGQGYDEYKAFLKEKLSTNLKNLSDDQIATLYESVKDETIMSENARYFFSKTKDLTVHHFKSSEYYLTNYTNYEMVPGRFNGCASIG
jgi:hypothetical protein